MLIKSYLLNEHLDDIWGLLMIMGEYGGDEISEKQSSRNSYKILITDRT